MDEIQRGRSTPSRSSIEIEATAEVVSEQVGKCTKGIFRRILIWIMKKMRFNRS